MRYFYVLAGICCMVWLSSCSNPEDKNIQDIKIDVSFSDLHLDLANLDTHNVPASVRHLQEKYGHFVPFFLSEIAALDTSRGYSDTMVRMFFTYKDLRNLHDTVAQVFNNTKDIRQQLTTLFKQIRAQDTSITIPKHVIFYTSGLHHVAFTYKDTILGIGLDRFFGSGFWPYEAMNYPQYVTRNLIIEHIPLEAAKTIFHNKYGISYEDKNLLDLMIQEGKMLYFLRTVLPDFSDEKILGYTPEQLKWCAENEVYIYKFFTDQDLFYEKSPIKIMRYIAPAPTSMGMPDQSPGRTGAYIGYQIIRSYAEKTGKDLYEILHTDNAQEIFNTAKYKPKR